MTYTNMELRICPELIREEKYGTPYLSGINPEFFRAAGQNSPCLPQINASDNSGYVFPFNSSGSIPYMNGSIFPCRPRNGNSIIRSTASDISQQTSVCQLNIIALDKENPRIAGYPFNDSSTSYPKFRIVNLDTDNKNFASYTIPSLIATDNINSCHFKHHYHSSMVTPTMASSTSSTPSFMTATANKLICYSICVPLKIL